MNCPRCGGKSRLVEARATDDAGDTVRKRRCEACGLRWSTCEVERGAYKVLQAQAQRLGELLAPKEGR